MPISQQRPITRARTQLNYQVKSFFAVQTNYPPNGVLLNPCDDFLMIRNLKYEPDWRMDYNDNKQVEGGMRKGMIGPRIILQVWTASSDFQELTTSSGHNSLLRRSFKAHESSLERS